MKQEIIITGKTVELALKEAAERLGVSQDKLTYEVIENEKQGFLGIGSTPAKVKITCAREGGAVAKEFIDKLLLNMKIDAVTELNVMKKSDREINIKGEVAGILIGHHGETLDALQYLVNLAANKREEDESRDYVHITVDVENYRSKREATLRSLARRMADRVKKYKKSVMLEPMPPNERRIIHSEVQLIDGISTNSIGADNNRRVVIYLESEGFNVPTRERKTEKLPVKHADKPEHTPQRTSPKRKPSPTKPAATVSNEFDEDITAEELSNLISTYATKERPQREQPTKFKSFDDYIDSLIGGSDNKPTDNDKSRNKQDDNK